MYIVFFFSQYLQATVTRPYFNKLSLMASGSLYCSRGPFTSAYQKTSAPTSSSKATLEEGVGSFKFRTLKGLSTESEHSYRSRVRSALGAPGRLRASLWRGCDQERPSWLSPPLPGRQQLAERPAHSRPCQGFHQGALLRGRVLSSCCSWEGSFLTARRLLGPRLAVRVSGGPAVLCHRT